MPIFGKSCLDAIPCIEWVLGVQELATVVPEAISRTLRSRLPLPPHWLQVHKAQDGTEKGTGK